MKTLTFNIPDTLDLDKRELTMLLVTRLYELGKLSLGQAAEMAGYTKRSFIEVLGKYNVSLFNYDINDLENDIRNASNYNI
jgi:predicted HTH domain antitoxin